MAGLRERQHAQLRQEVSRAGIRLFAEKGFADTTVDEIVEPLGISKRTFFRHFATKEDIVFVWYEDLTAELGEACAARPAKEDPYASVCAALRGLLAYYDADPAWAKAMLGVASETPALVGRSYEKRSIWERELAKVIAPRLPKGQKRELFARITASAAVNAFALGVDAWNLAGRGDIRAYVDAAFAHAGAVAHRTRG